MRGKKFLQAKRVVTILSGPTFPNTEARAHSLRSSRCLLLDVEKQLACHCSIANVNQDQAFGPDGLRAGTALGSLLALHSESCSRTKIAMGEGHFVSWRLLKVITHIELYIASFLCPLFLSAFNRASQVETKCFKRTGSWPEHAIIS